MPNDTELKQLIIYVGTQAKVNEARQAGTIGPDDFAVVTDAPDFALQSTVQAIQVLIPSQATAQNQLADKNYVDNSTLPSSTKYGASLLLTVNSTDYKVTATLKDQDGNTLGTSQVIDLPLESVVVGGTYDSTNKKIVLTLENGNTIDVPVGDLVAGLQTEITAQNKLSSDLVDDINNAHKFVSSQEKTTWNNKQNAITGGASTITTDNLTANRALISNGDGKVSVSGVTSTELGYLSGATSAIQTQLNSKANTSDVNTALDNKIDKGYAVNDFATNCITEIPQDIKLELNNGTLTLKSGGIITAPDGTQIQTTVDKSTTYNSNGKRYVYYNTSTNYITIGSTMSETCSGTSDSLAGVAWHTWYDTTNNIIKRYVGDGTTVSYTTYSLPIAIATVSNGAITSIDQVFNGFGYIGQSKFLLPGVKVLLANGRNTDGSLKSRSFTNNSLQIATSGGTYNRRMFINNGSFQVTVNAWYYREDTNLWYDQNDIPFTSNGVVYLGDCFSQNDVITKFDVRPVSGLSANYINTALGYTPYNSSNPSGYITQAVDDNSTTSTTLGWSASKLDGIIGDIETALHTINSGV